jgi:hypothetical protein
MSVVATGSSVISVNPDLNTLFEAIRGIQSAHGETFDRRAGNLPEGQERRAASRILMRVPVQIAAAVVEPGRVRLMDGVLDARVTDLSMKGVALTHSESFLHFYFAITFPLPSADPVLLLAELQWTMQESKGVYRSGARISGLIEAA